MVISLERNYNYDKGLFLTTTDMNETGSTNLMEAANTLITIIDVQTKLVRVIENQAAMTWNIRRLIDASVILGVKRIYTEQNPEKLGDTISLLGKNIEYVPYKKMSFNCFASNQIVKDIEQMGVRSIVLCGVETHVCVQQTALEMMANGYIVYIAIDAVGSRNRIDHEISIKRLQSAGVIISTTESIIFEWCHRADRDEFKEISNLIKQKMPP